MSIIIVFSAIALPGLISAVIEVRKKTGEAKVFMAVYICLR